MLESPLAGCVLLGGIEPAKDIGVAGAPEALAACRRLVAITPYADPAVMAAAQVLLPMGSFAETSGSYVSVEGRWQEFRGCAQPVGEARPGWKILRVLGNQLGLEGFEYESSAECPRGAARARRSRRATTGAWRPSAKASRNGAARRRTCRSTAWTPWCAARRRCR